MAPVSSVLGGDPAGLRPSVPAHRLADPLLGADGPLRLAPLRAHGGGGSRLSFYLRHLSLPGFVSSPRTHGGPAGGRRPPLRWAPGGEARPDLGQCLRRRPGPGHGPRGVPEAAVWRGRVHTWGCPLRPGLGAHVDGGLPLWATSPCYSTALGGPGTSVGMARTLGSGAQVRPEGWPLGLGPSSFLPASLCDSPHPGPGEVLSPSS